MMKLTFLLIKKNFAGVLPAFFLPKNFLSKKFLTPKIKIVL